MRRTRTPAALVVTVALLSAGCGDDSAGDGEEASDQSSTQAEAGELPEPLAERLRSELLIEQQRLKPSEADCAIERLGETLSDDQIEIAENAEPLPPDITAVVFDAGARCAGR